MKRKLLRWTLWLILADCSITAPLFLSQPAQATSNVSSMTTYYSDSAHTAVVGQKAVFCNGQVSQFGTTSAFITVKLFPCLVG